MKIETKIEFTREDVAELLKAEFVKLTGPVKAGYELSALDRYSTGSWTVEAVEKEAEPKKADEAVF